MKALIFAAGLGTRLRPLTDSLPKALVSVGGEPLLRHVIGRLKAAGFDDVVVNVCFFADKIIAYLSEHDNFGIKVSVSDERGVLQSDALRAGATSGSLSKHGRKAGPQGVPSGQPPVDASAELPPAEASAELPPAEASAGLHPTEASSGLPPVEAPLETGGGIRYAEPLLRGCGKFLIHNVDIVSDLDIPWFMAQSRPGSLATLLVSDRKTQRYFLFDDDMRLVGWTNIATGEVRSPYPDLDPSRYRKLAFAGIHILSEDAFPLFEPYGFGRKFSITDFYIRACREHPIYGVAPEKLTLIDVGKPDTLVLADTWLREHPSHSI
jgi:NDP-sugar pyrophosphorylase family protein